MIEHIFSIVLAWGESEGQGRDAIFFFPVFAEAAGMLGNVILL